MKYKVEKEKREISFEEIPHGAIFTVIDNKEEFIYIKASKETFDGHNCFNLTTYSFFQMQLDVKVEMPKIKIESE